MEIILHKVKKEDCTGCYACVNICSAQAITMVTDEEGFEYPRIDTEKCNRCGGCAKVCPIAGGFLPDGRKFDRKIYAAWSLDREIRYNSTSGGIFTELALSILETGGFICGAIYDDSHMVRHIITDKKQDLSKLRQSKYVQSDMGNIYKKIGDLLAAQKRILFCGSPCHCAGLFNFCKENKINCSSLYLVDFICRGANSPKVYRKFLEELQIRYHSDIKKVWFKNKTYGWNRFSTKIEFGSGEAYLKDRYHDPYIRGYIEENLFIRPACTACRFKGFQRISDLTLADFWGIRLDGRSQDSDGGTSAVMVHTEKGEGLWNSISQRIYKEEKRLEDVTLANECFYSSVRPGYFREQFMKDLDKMPVMDNISRFLKNTDRTGAEYEGSKS